MCVKYNDDKILSVTNIEDLGLTSEPFKDVLIKGAVVLLWYQSSEGKRNIYIYMCVLRC